MRKIITAMLIMGASLLSSCSIIRSLKGVKKIQSFEAIGTLPAEEHIPFELVNNHIVVTLKVGRDTMRDTKFILDTGAPTLLSKEYADEHHLALYELNGPKISGATAEVKTTKYLTDSITFNIGKRLTVLKPHTFVNSLSATFSKCEPIAGLLGVDVLSRFNLFIDFSKKEIVLYAKDSVPAFAKNYKYKVDFSNLSPFQKTPLVDIKLNGARKQTFIWDAGFNGNFVVQYKSKNKLKKWLAAQPNRTEVESFAGFTGISGSINNVYTTQYIKNDTLIVDKTVIPFTPVNTPYVINDKNVLPVMANVGISFMKRFKMLISWKDKTIYLEPDSADTSDYKPLPNIVAGYDFDSKQVSIRYVRKDSKAYKNGLRAGTELFMIDDKKTLALLGPINGCTVDKDIAALLKKAHTLNVINKKDDRRAMYVID